MQERRANKKRETGASRTSQKRAVQMKKEAREKTISHRPEKRSEGAHWKHSEGRISRFRSLFFQGSGNAAEN